MPRDRGFRDTKTLKLVPDAVKQLSRVRFTRYGNAFISRTQRSKDPHILRFIRDAQARHDNLHGWRYHRRLRSANHGQTVAIKDNIVTVRLPTSCASNILRGYMAPRNSTVARRLEDAGMVLLAKTNMDEFGMGSHSTHSAFGPVYNGVGDAALSVGGSSGGSALAVAAGTVHTAIGTDTGGSVRLPAAYLGLVGFKPSYGRISRYGVIPYSNSLDTVGIIAKSCLDIFLTFQILDLPDELDPTCLTDSTRRRLQANKRGRLSSIKADPLSIVPLNVEHSVWNELRILELDKKQKYDTVRRAPRSRRIGVPLEYNIAELHPSVRQAWTMTLSHLQAQGHEIVPISLPSTKQALSSYYVLAPAEASSNLAKYDGVRYGGERAEGPDDIGGVLYARYRGDHFGEEVKRRILLGSYSLSAGAMDNYFLQAQRVRRMVQDDFNLIFRLPHPLYSRSKGIVNGIDYIVCPTAPTPPPTLAFLETSTPVESYMNDVFTVPASLAGLPAISVPAPRPSGVLGRPATSIGMQIIGQYGDDYAVIQFAKNALGQLVDTAAMRRLEPRSKIK